MENELLRLVREIHAAVCVNVPAAPIMRSTKRKLVYEAMEIGKIVTPHTLREKMGDEFLTVQEIRNGLNGLASSGLIARVVENHFKREQ